MQAYTSPRKSIGFQDNRLIIWGLGVVVIAAILLIGFFYNRHEIKVFADGKTTTIVMRGGTVHDAVQKANVKLSPKDVITPPLNSSIDKNQQINVSRRINITVIADGKVNEYWVPEGTVEKTLSDLKVSVRSGDKVSLDGSKKLAAGDQIEITRFAEKYITQTLKVPFKIEKRKDNSMFKGQTRTVSAGKDGSLQKIIKITMKNGREVKREVVSVKTVITPVNKIIAFGSLSSKVISRGKAPIKFSHVIKMHATAYTYTGFRTATGVSPYRGVVAVDPSIIPLGAKLYIEGYGYAKALDVGSAIRGNRIDLFLESTSQARNWGRRTVSVYVLE